MPLGPTTLSDPGVADGQFFVSWRPGILAYNEDLHMLNDDIEGAKKKKKKNCYEYYKVVIRCCDEQT